ncbi:MAG: type II secretion system F family protein [Kineosporiaceae bacterium]
MTGVAPVAAALAALLVLSGVWAAVTGVQRRAAPPPRYRRRGALSQLVGRRLSRRTRWLLGVGSVAGIAVAVTTGWVIAVVVLPAALAGLPILLTAPEPAARIDRLEAMEEWTRALAGVLTVGVGLEQALVATLRSTPAPIRAEVSTLVARLRARWSTPDAIRAFADDLDDATGDLIAANLLLGAHRRGSGLASVLQGLAESVAADVRARRAIEADRAKPRSTARWITLITVGVLGLLALNGPYVAPYGSGVGQLVLALLLALYVATLLWLRSMARGERLPRFLGDRTPAGGRPL